MRELTLYNYLINALCEISQEVLPTRWTTAFIEKSTHQEKMDAISDETFVKLHADIRGHERFVVY